MLQTIYEILLAPIILAISLTGVGTTPRLGAALPSATAVFETSLASPITSSATSMTLSANAVRGGGSISGYNCFTIDEGSAQAETTCGTVSGTAVTSLSRGISQATGTTTVAALQFSHRRGANVKITDFPLVQILKAQNNGEDTFENTLKYASGVTTAILGTNNQNLASVAYANSLSFGAVPAASESASGFVELATQVEAASSTSLGSTGARLVLPASMATSTYNSATAPSRVVMTGLDGKIDNYFIATSSILNGGDFTFGSSTVIGSTRALDIGKNIAVITTTGSTTWAIPSGITRVGVHVVGGGGAGGEDEVGGGGGYAYKILDVSATTSLSIRVAPTWGGGSGTCTPRDPSDYSAVYNGTTFVRADSGGCGGPNAAGGAAIGGDINIRGGRGFIDTEGASYHYSFSGGTLFSESSFVQTCAGVDCAGGTPEGYGGGGNATLDISGSSSANGGDGAQGVVIISY